MICNIYKIKDIVIEKVMILSLSLSVSINGKSYNFNYMLIAKDATVYYKRTKDLEKFIKENIHVFKSSDLMVPTSP